jgi:predicted DsbA family dithiol-disulfide isomerase
MVATAAADGIEMRPERTRVVNTFDAHRLLQLARARGLQDAVGERFLRAQHCEGEALGDHATLERLAVEAGLEAPEVRAVLAGDAYADEVRDDERTAAAIGIGGVPFFVADRAFAASGAQPPDVLREVLRQAWAAQGATAARAAP